MIYSKKVKNLGISDKDFKILKTLNTLKQSNVSSLAQYLRLPRTTIEFRLKNLLSRDWMEKIKIKNHWEWQVSNNFQNIFLNDLGENEIKITYYRGDQDIENVLIKILGKKNGERIYFIEPYRQVKKFISKTNKKILVITANLFKKGKYISEGITSEKNIELLENYDKEVLRHMKGRMTIVYTIPDEYLSFEDMIIVNKNSVYLFNFYSNIATEIKNGSFAKSMKSTIIALVNFGKKVDLNQQIGEILKQKLNKGEK